MADQPQPVPVIKLQEDQPVLGNKDYPDLLGLEPFAETLAGVALGTEGPFTIGIYGGWGVGKTSMLHMVKHLLEEDAKLKRNDRPDIVTVWFNPWQFECEEHPLFPLIGAIASALEKRAKDKGVFRDLHTCFKALLASMELSVTVLGTGVKIDLDKAVNRDGQLRDNMLKKQTVYPEAFEKLEACSRALKGKGRIVVFVDDLDRCQPRNAIKLLEAVKLALGQPGFIFFLAVDNEIIEGYLAHVYKQDLELPGAVAEDEDGAYRDLAQRYLHKLVQMDFPIPSHVDDRFDDYLRELTAGAVAEDQRDELVTILRLGAGANPRSAVRMVNRLRVQACLWETSGCAVEGVRPEQIVLLMAFSDVLLDRLGPRRFEQLVNNQDDCDALLAQQTSEDGEEQPALTEATRAVTRISAEERRVMAPLLEAQSAGDWLSRADLRKAIHTFFQRTETISEVPETQQAILDRAVRNALGLAPDAPILARRLGEVTALNLGGQRDFGDAGMALLPGLPNLRELQLGSTLVSDAGLQHIGGLDGLENLDLQGTDVLDAGLAHLGGLASLQRLFLPNTPVSDAGLVHLSCLKGLRQLNLRDTRVSDGGLACLSSLTCLQYLTLKHVPISDAGLAHLANLTKLEWLDLARTQVSDAGLAHLQGLTSLQHLDLDSTLVSDAGLAHLAGLTALRRLILARTQVSDAGLAHLEGLTSLQHLILSGTQVSDAGVAALKQRLPDCSIQQ